MKGILNLAARLLLMKKWRTILTILGVSFGIGLMISMVILQGKMDLAVEKEIKVRFGEVDMLVGYRSSEKLLNTNQLEDIKALNGVLEASPVLVNPQLSIENLKYPSNGIYYIGYDNSPLAKSYYKITEDLGNSDVILSKNLADKLNVKVNQFVNAPLPGGITRKFNVTEVFQPISAEIPDTMILPIQMLQESAMIDDKVNLVLLKLTPNANKQFVAEQLKDEIDPDLDIDFLTNLDETKKNIGNIKILGYGLGVITILISCLFVLGNFQLTFYERVKELAILRAIGGSRKQVFMLVLAEGIIVGFLGMLLGIILGIISANTLSSIISKLLDVQVVDAPINWLGIVSTSVLAFFFTILVILIPARRTSKILPIQATRISESEEYKQPRKWSFIISMFLILVGTFMLIFAKHFNVLQTVLSMVGGLTILIGIGVGFSHFVSIFLKLLLRIFRRFGDGISFVSVKNANAQRKNSNMTILILSTAIALSIGAASVFTTIKYESIKNLKHEFVSDLVGSSSMQMMSSLPYKITKEIQEIPGVNEVIPVSTWGSAPIIKINENAKNQRFNFLLTEQEKLLNERMIPSSVKKYKNPAVLTKEYAKKLGVSVGDTIVIEVNGKEMVLTVGAVMDYLPGAINVIDHALVDWNVPILGNENKKVKSLLIEIDKTKLSEVSSGLNQLGNKYSELRWSSYEKALIITEKQIGQRIAIFISVLAVILIIGTLGIVNTLAANIFAKRHEFAILRSISLTPLQLKKLIISQGILYSFLAVMIGSIMGIVFAMSLVQALSGTMIFPYTTYIAIISCVCFLAFIISLAFSHRIGKKPIIDSLKIE
jgi:putative ABC transport system permease protein